MTETKFKKEISAYINEDTTLLEKELFRVGKHMCLLESEKDGEAIRLDLLFAGKNLMVKHNLSATEYRKLALKIFGSLPLLKQYITALYKLDNINSIIIKIDSEEKSGLTFLEYSKKDIVISFPFNPSIPMPVFKKLVMALKNDDMLTLNTLGTKINHVNLYIH